MLFRTNPARDRERDWAHDAAAVFAGLWRARGVTVLNDPEVMRRGANKLSLVSLPEESRRVAAEGAEATLTRAGQNEGPEI